MSNKTHYFIDENGKEHCLAPIPGCDCMQCHYEEQLRENGRQGENQTTVSNGTLFGYEESKQSRQEERREDRWLERHGYS